MTTLVFLVSFVAYAMTISTQVVNTDVAANSLTAWRIAHTGQPWMEGLDLEETGKVPHYGVGRDGHIVTTRTPGQILAAVPFYLGSSPNQAEMEPTVGRFGRSGLAAAALTAGCIALIFSGIHRQRPNLVLSLGAVGVLGFTTPMWSVSANALWTHPITVLGIGGAVWALARERWWLVGVWLAVGMTGRVHIALIAAVLGVGIAWSRRSPSIAWRIGVPTLVSLALLSGWNYYVFGSFDPRGAYAGHAIGSLVPAVSQGSSGYLVNLAGFLVSPDRGLLVWTPLLLVLFPAVIRGWTSAPDWSRWLALGGVVYAVAQVGLNVFHGGDAFYGYRLALELLVSVAPLYAFCAYRAGMMARRAAPVVIGLQAGAILIGAVFEWTFLPETLVWRDNSLVHALKDHPTALIPVFVLVTALVSLITRLLLSNGHNTPAESPFPTAHTSST